ncbi:hypothetical protein HDU81_005805 [Chytriomyces hyalinus]|nr:hypothetical protein HDU81_005805 [Chytriomyces hyalinus]
MSSVSRSAAAPTATNSMDLAVETDLGTVIASGSAVPSAVATGAPAAGAGGADFAALEQAIPPCALACAAQYTSLEAACAAASTIMACGEAACTGPDLTRFDAIITELAPLCGGAAPTGAAQGTAAAGTAVAATASAAVKTNGTKAAGSAAATGTATKAATTVANKGSNASMMQVFGLFASAAALLVL